MLVTIAAAVTALAPVERPVAAVQPAPRAFLAPAAPMRAATACKSAGRMQVGYDRTLLYRPDPNDRARKLIDMPMAQGCLLGGAR